ncbi:toxin-antitoxin system YwqK family antitoxin [uncultured Croceitalea sp.]|uniref:toxin-antitoxin system YwqK family antitoxin n=1 Tax=uncultured Croceitalea sp. TaxID=1798908 RepID=UPI0033068DBF
MKSFFSSLLSLSFLLIGCSEQKGKSITNDPILEIPDTFVEKSVLRYNHKTMIWTLKGSPYSGFAQSYHGDNTLKEEFGILNGKKQHKFIQWYPDGHFKNVSMYDRGRLHGEKKIWSVDSPHVLIGHYHYHKGKPHGEQKKWYSTGELYKKINLNRGKEEGLQQAFRKNGALYANYEARAGRIFGLKKAKLCYSLKEENVQYKK